MDNHVNWLTSHGWELAMTEEEGCESWRFPHELRKNWPSWAKRQCGTQHFWDREEAIEFQMELIHHPPQKEVVSVTVDAVIFDSKLENLLLIKRKHPPFVGKWALPGGYVNIDELLDDAVVREVEEETHLKCFVGDNDEAFMCGLANLEPSVDHKYTGKICLQRLDIFDKVNRDPRGRVFSVAYWGIMTQKQDVQADDDAGDYKWILPDSTDDLAFDHAGMVQKVVAKLFSREADDYRSSLKRRS